jgi:hypothetical protein
MILTPQRSSVVRTILLVYPTLGTPGITRILTYILYAKYLLCRGCPKVKLARAKRGRQEGRPRNLRIEGRDKRSKCSEPQRNSEKRETRDLMCLSRQRAKIRGPARYAFRTCEQNSLQYELLASNSYESYEQSIAARLPVPGRERALLVLLDYSL